MGPRDRRHRARFAEFFADKIAWVDSAWDAVHSFIRLLGGAFLSLAIIDAADPAWQVGSFLLGGGAALVAHAGKAGARTWSTPAPSPSPTWPCRPPRMLRRRPAGAGHRQSHRSGDHRAWAGFLSIWLVFAARRALRKLIDRLNPAAGADCVNRAPAKTKHDPRWTLVMSVAASSLSFIDGSILNVALPAIRASTGAGAAEVQWVVRAICYAAARRADPARRRARRPWAPPVAGDRHRAVRCWLAGLRAERSLEMLLAGRPLQGIGAALLLPNSLALLNGAFEGEARGQAIGTWAAAGAIAAAIAPLIGGWLVENVGWPSIFYINLPLVAAAILVAQTGSKKSRSRKRRGWISLAPGLATLGLGAATYGLTLWSQKFAQPRGTVGIIAGAACWFAFLCGSDAAATRRWFRSPCSATAASRRST